MPSDSCDCNAQLIIRLKTTHECRFERIKYEYDGVRKVCYILFDLSPDSSVVQYISRCRFRISYLAFVRLRKSTCY